MNLVFHISEDGSGKDVIFQIRLRGGAEDWIQLQGLEI